MRIRGASPHLHGGIARPEVGNKDAEEGDEEEADDIAIWRRGDQFGSFDFGTI